ncbi:MAG: hypothetical protein GY746_07450 [Gammaproteobacteria bacterium]|nr:hypothetical protein [Gammaproteobacteria bacterium]
MKFARIEGLGSVGLNTDLASWQLPQNAWTALTNVRCDNGKIGPFPGHGDFATPSVTPYGLIPAASGAIYYWVYPGLVKCYAYDGTTHHDITGTDFTGDAGDRFNSTMINGMPIINNGKDLPQSWNPDDNLNNLTALTGWTGTHTCKVMRAYKDFLFALDITKGSTNYPYMVKWSASDSSGSVPIDWDETSTTNDAGENNLGDTLGVLVDAVPLRDALMIYKEDSVYGCQYIGGAFTHRFYRISGLSGLLAQDCAVEFGGKHFVVGDGDVYVHDGQNGQSVIDQKNRDFLFNAIDADNYTNTFVTLYKAKSEIWICYPGSGQTFANKALIWNYQDNTWYSRNLPTGTTFIAPGVVTTASYKWSDLNFSWANWGGVWGTRSYSPVSDSLIGATTETKLFQFEDGNQFDEVDASCTAERIGLDIGDTSDAHTVTAVYPYVEGGSVDIYVGSQMHVNDSVDWEGPYTFDPSTAQKINCRSTGILHSIRYQSNADVHWNLTGHLFEYEFAGRR